MNVHADTVARSYAEQGYAAPVRVLSAEEAESYRARLDAAADLAGPELARRLLKMKSHLVFGCLDELARHPAVLDAVESILGPDILVWSSSIFAKAARTPDFVSWHQDMTYWGLNPPDIVTAWIALTDSGPDNGCMRVVPGSHRLEIMPHRDTYAADNMLSRGQEVAVEVDERQAADIVLEPGEMSLHHAKIVHGSRANASARPRIGFAVRYISPAVRQSAGAEDSVMLVRGRDAWRHFAYDPRPRADFDREALPAYEEVCERSRKILLRPLAAR
jgi:hypothetical protein